MRMRDKRAMPQRRVAALEVRASAELPSVRARASSYFNTYSPKKAKMKVEAKMNEIENGFEISLSGTSAHE